MKKEELFRTLEKMIRSDKDHREDNDNVDMMILYYREILEDMMENGMEEEEACRYLLEEAGNYYHGNTPDPFSAASASDVPEQAPDGNEFPVSNVSTDVCSYSPKDEENALSNASFPVPACSEDQDSERNTSWDADGFTALDITVESENVILNPSRDKELSIDYEDSQYGRLETNLQNGVLYIRIVREKRSFFNFFGMAGDDELKISLPVEKYQSLVFRSTSGSFEDYAGASYETLNIRTTSGDVTLDQGIHADNVVVNTTSGDVYFRKACDASFVQVKTNSGDLYLDGKTITKRFTFITQSGDFEAEKELEADVLNLSTVSGDIRVRKADNRLTEIKTVSGDLDVKSLDATESIRMNTISGDLELKQVKTKRIDARTVSGDVEIRAVDPMTCFVKTVSGDVHYPKKSQGSGEIHVNTTSGDIDIRY